VATCPLLRLILYPHILVPAIVKPLQRNLGCLGIELRPALIAVGHVGQMRPADGLVPDLHRGVGFLAAFYAFDEIFNVRFVGQVALEIDMGLGGPSSLSWSR